MEDSVRASLVLIHSPTAGLWSSLCMSGSSRGVWGGALHSLGKEPSPRWFFVSRESVLLHVCQAASGAVGGGGGTDAECAHLCHCWVLLRAGVPAEILMETALSGVSHILLSGTQTEVSGDLS